MPELPTGTVTFFFSDLEGSTRLVRSAGDAWPRLLDRHRGILRAAFAANGGVEVGTEGDSFFAAFPTAPGAVAAAVDAQRGLAAEAWPEGSELKARIGLHTGEGETADGTYVGLAVHRASRVAGAAHGGQVLVSDVTRALVAESLPDGVTMRDLGEHRLKDLGAPERIWQLLVDGLQSDFPPIGSVDATPNNLPRRLTTFLGRQGEIDAVSRLLAEHRLLTLTGPGGTGKTRLSLEVAEREIRLFPDGVYFVELASVTDPELVPAAILGALGLPDHGARPPLDRLADHVGQGRVLLVLDNFEQVVPAGASVTQLLAACPHLSVLVSSRSALGVSGEQEYPVPPLGLPDPDHLPPLAQLSQYEAVALFIERARAVRPDFEVTNENAPAVAEICVQLDGLPLAIELAAARIRVLSPQAMLARLGDRLGLLSSGARDLPARQQTLRGAIAWSHDLLDETDRALFACLSVFVGGATYDQVDRVCTKDLGAALLDALDSLVEKSLVRRRDGADGEPRFGMLETIREYAIEQAVERGAWESLRERHARAYAEVAASSADLVMGADSGAWLDRLGEDHDNLRAAYGWALEHDPALALRMGADLWRFWQRRGHIAEGLEHVEAALAAPGAADHPEAKADALEAAAGLAYWRADTERSRRYYGEEIAAREAIGDRAGLANAHYGMSFTYSVMDLGSPDVAATAEGHITEALDIYRELNDDAGIARCEWALANVLWGAAQELEPAAEHAANALRLFRQIGDSFMVGWAEYTLGLASLSMWRRDADASRFAEAHDRLAGALRTFREASDLSGYTLVLDALAALAFHGGERARAARLAGAVAALERTSGTGLNLWNREQLAFEPEALLDDPALAAEFAAGEALDPDRAVAYALGEVSA